MAKASGGTRGSGGGSGNYVPNTAEGIDLVKRSLMEYTPMDKWNRNTEYQMGFNSDAQQVVERVANANLGFASQVAQTATKSPNWDKYGYRLSEKQSYIIAKAAVEHKLVSQDKVIFNLKVERDAKAKVEAQRAQKERAYKSYSQNYVKSSTKVAVGSKVTDSKGRTGTISSIITKSSGYVTVKYSDGTTSKQMAFNLKGADGNPLKKRPKN